MAARAGSGKACLQTLLWADPRKLSNRSANTDDRPSLSGLIMVGSSRACRCQSSPRVRRTHSIGILTFGIDDHAAGWAAASMPSAGRPCRPPCASRCRPSTPQRPSRRSRSLWAAGTTGAACQYREALSQSIPNVPSVSRPISLRPPQLGIAFAAVVRNPNTGYGLLTRRVNCDDVGRTGTRLVDHAGRGFCVRIRTSVPPS